MNEYFEKIFLQNIFLNLYFIIGSIFLIIFTKFFVINSNRIRIPKPFKSKYFILLLLFFFPTRTVTAYRTIRLKREEINYKIRKKPK